VERRSFLKQAGAGVAAGATLATPALAADLPTIKWRCASAFPKSLDTIYGGAEVMAKKVAEMTGGKFQIQVFSAGEIVPGPAVADAVKDATVEMGHATSYYFVGKDPTFALDTAIPFGLNYRQMTAWMYHGGGLELIREFLATYNIYSIPCGNTGAQMGGWFRKEIKTVKDLEGLKFRVGGFAGQVLAKLGVVPQQIPGGDIYPALEKGTIDAAEFVGPYDDQKLGFNKVAKFYYYPGWWEGGPQISTYINTKKWAELPKEYQAIVEAACSHAHVDMMAKYDAKNPVALKQLVGSGTQLRPFPNEVMAACYKASQELYAETSAKNPAFKKIYDSMKKFQEEQLQWFAVAENRYDNFMQAARAAAKK
jgi:TRAP-type mannitol/chloroaromatic compound transport system substrate-binding protein